MSKASTYIILLILLFSFNYGAFAFQQSANQELGETLDTKITRHGVYNPVEKIFIHTDREVYTNGDDVWFSIHTLFGKTNQYLQNTEVVYIELVNQQNEIINNKKIITENGRGHGDFLLPYTLESGVYTIRSYTSWMLNFAEDHYFEKQIQVLNSASSKFQKLFEFSLESKGKESSSFSVGRLLNPNDNLKSVQLSLKSSTGEYIELSVNEQSPLTINNEVLHNLEAAILTIVYDTEYEEKFNVLEDFKTKKINAYILPEGGKIVAAMPNRVAVKLIGHLGDPIQTNIHLLENGVEILSFASNQFGLADFRFIPKLGSEYELKVDVEDVAFEVEVDFPQIYENGLLLNVEVFNPNFISIQLTQNMRDDELLRIVTILNEGQSVLVKPEMVGRNGSVIRVQKSDLPAGVNIVSILNENLEPLTERAFFNYPQNEIPIEINLSDFQFRAKQKGEITFETDRQSFNNVTFSIAITDASIIDQYDFEKENILSSILLSSELKGKIINPSYYFTGDLISKNKELDLVMLTHGWRNINWDEIKQEDTKLPTITVENGINLKGKVTGLTGRTGRVGGGTITAIVNDAQADEIIEITYGEDGLFELPDMVFSDTTSVILTVLDKRLKSKVLVEVEVDDKFQSNLNLAKDRIKSGSAISELEAAFYKTANMESTRKFLEEYEQVVDLEEVIIKSAPEAIGINKMYGSGNVVLEPSNDPSATGSTDIFSYLQGKVAGVIVGVNPIGQASIQIRGPGSIGLSSDPLILLDNMEIPMSQLFTIPMSSVASIDIFKDGASNAIFGVSGANGVIAVYTKSGGVTPYQTEGVFVLQKKGYSISREYMPVNPQNNPTIADNRPTLYWNPSFNPAKKITFYNNDKATKIRVVLQGIDADGNLIYATESFSEIK